MNTLNIYFVVPNDSELEFTSLVADVVGEEIKVEPEFGWVSWKGEVSRQFVSMLVGYCVEKGLNFAFVGGTLHVSDSFSLEW